jgi:hypothetical protein
VFAALLLSFHFAFAAINCTLDHPDRDIKRFFPESTNYRVRDLFPFRHGSKELVPTLEREMGGQLDAEYESPLTPQTFYVVYKDSQYIGLIHGMNAHGQKGPIQAFVIYKPDGQIKDIFIQKVSSPDAPAFRSKYYRRQFASFGTAHVPEVAHVKPPVRLPSKETINDHHSVARAVRLSVLLVKHLYNKFKE